MDIFNVRGNLMVYQIKGYFSSLKGNHYEIGKQQGEFVKKSSVSYSTIYTARKFNMG